MSDLYRVSKAICQSGKFECGQGCCAPICMENLGVARDKCTRCMELHGDLAGQILLTLETVDYNFPDLKTLYPVKPAVVLERVKQACLFEDDGGGIGVTTDPSVSAELFNDIILATLSAKRQEELLKELAGHLSGLLDRSSVLVVLDDDDRDDMFASVAIAEELI